MVVLKKTQDAELDAKKMLGFSLGEKWTGLEMYMAPCPFSDGNVAYK